jgi:hypothetical protein
VAVANHGVIFDGNRQDLPPQTEVGLSCFGCIDGPLRLLSHWFFGNDGQLAIFHDDFMLTKELTRTVAGDPTEITVYAIRSPSRYDRMS